MSEFLPAASLMLCGVVFLTFLAAWPKQWDGQLALVFAPGTTQERVFSAVTALDARVVRSGGMANVVIVDLDRVVSMTEIRSLGAWLALDPVIAGACISFRTIDT